MKPENLDRAIEIKKKLTDIAEMRTEIEGFKHTGKAVIRTGLSYDLHLTGNLLDKVIDLLMEDFNEQEASLTKELETL